MDFQPTSLTLTECNSPGIEGDENEILTVSGILLNKKSKGQPHLVALERRQGYRSLKAEILIGRDRITTSSFPPQFPPWIFHLIVHASACVRGSAHEGDSCGRTQNTRGNARFSSRFHHQNQCSRGCPRPDSARLPIRHPGDGGTAVSAGEAGRIRPGISQPDPEASARVAQRNLSVEFRGPTLFCMVAGSGMRFLEKIGLADTLDLVKSECF